MEKMTSPNGIIEQIGERADVEYRGSSRSDRMRFRYENGHIDAHRLPDEYRFVGFGSNWFALEPDQ